MSNIIDFKDYLKENKIIDSCKICRLESPITFDDIGIQIGLYFDKRGIVSIDLEPEYHNMEYAEIDIEFYAIQEYSLTMNNKQLYCEKQSYYSKVLDFTLNNEFLSISLLLDNGKQAQLDIKFKYFLLDYDKLWQSGYEILEILYAYKKEKNKLLEMMYSQVDDEILSAEYYTLYYSYYKNELFEILEKYQETQKLSACTILNECKIFDLHTHNDIRIIQREIAQSFPFVLYLTVSYEQLGYEEPTEYWLVKLCILSRNFSKTYKEELLKFYIDYLFTKHTYSNPSILLSFLIIVMMTILDYPQKEVDDLFEEFYKLDYVKRYDCHFFPKEALKEFKYMITVLNDQNKEQKLFDILSQMILE